MRLKKMFSKKGAAFMPYVCFGDPNPGFTDSLVKTLAQHGADGIEFGIPFSDPIADGKTIQGASMRALSAGATPKKALDAIAKLRREGVEMPIVVMTYYNIAYSVGVKNFVLLAKKSGVDGLIVPDVPIEEGKELVKACKKNGIGLVQLVSPNTPEKRLSQIARRASGFVYAVSVIGTTGARKNVDEKALLLVALAKKTKKPVAAGFGISTPKQAAAFARAGADGVIVGSSLVDVYSQHIRNGKINSKKALAAVAKFTRKMKGACMCIAK